MKFLCIDTSTAACSVALYNEGEINTLMETRPQVHSDRVLEMCDELLTKAEVPLNSLTAIGVTRGPGSFTGVRIGISVAQGISFAASVPVFPVSTLAMLAQHIHQRYGAEKVFCVADARMNEVYCGSYEYSEDQIMIATAEEALNSTNNVTPPSNPQQWTACGSGWSEYAAKLSATGIRFGHVYEKEEADASAMIPLVEHAAKQGWLIGPEQLEPVYLRNDVAHKKNA